MASIVSGSGSQLPGRKRMERIDRRLLLILLSPRTFVLSSRVASRLTFADVAGKIRPRIARISEESFTAWAKSPVIWCMAVRNRFPKLCPFRPRPLANRYRNRCESRSVSSERAVMQLRISPGGRISKSRRSLPELPPSSVTVTTAVISIGGRLGSGWTCAPAACFFSPERRVDNPVPPPIATMCKGLWKALLSKEEARVKQGMTHLLYSPTVPGSRHDALRRFCE